MMWFRGTSIARRLTIVALVFALLFGVFALPQIWAGNSEGAGVILASDKAGHDDDDDASDDDGVDLESDSDSDSDSRLRLR